MWFNNQYNPYIHKMHLTLNNSLIKKNEKAYNDEVLKKPSRLWLNSLKNKILNIK